MMSVYAFSCCRSLVCHFAEAMSFLEKIDKIEGEIMSMIDDDPVWQTLARVFSEIKGVAKRTISRLMAELPEIGIYDGST